VLIGDAKASAQFSIGSGTKLAMEDAIALYEAFGFVETGRAVLTMPDGVAIDGVEMERPIRL